MDIRLALIGGTGVNQPGWFHVVEERAVKTPYGEATVQLGEIDGVPVAFVSRHGPGHTVPPHRINYRANIWAIRAVGVRRIVATAAVGSLNEAMVPGDLVLVDQFLDFTRQRPITFFDGGPEGVVHTDVTDPYCSDLRRRLEEAARRFGFPVHGAGVYVAAEGPRYETRAEIRAYRMLGGDVIGMTGVPEVVLARELGLCYASIAMVTNMGAGMAANPVSHGEVEAMMRTYGARIRSLIGALLAELAAEGEASEGGEAPCRCQSA